jgi:DNA-binding transcriptional MerR regulator
MATKHDELPAIPDKRYFTIGEASELCKVKPHVLRYWEQEFPSLKPTKRRGNRRYYQVKDIELVRQIRDLLYQKGYTIQGAKKELINLTRAHHHAAPTPVLEVAVASVTVSPAPVSISVPVPMTVQTASPAAPAKAQEVNKLIGELESLLAEINI